MSAVLLPIDSYLQKSTLHHATLLSMDTFAEYNLSFINSHKSNLCAPYSFYLFRDDFVGTTVYQKRQVDTLAIWYPKYSR